jgi:hypothetical protein
MSDKAKIIGIGIAVVIVLMVLPVGAFVFQWFTAEPMPRQNDAQPLGPTAIEDVPQ